MTTRAEMSELRRESVYRATAALLDEVGIAALTVKLVAERAGVAQGSVFLYAESMPDLVNKVYGLRIAEKWHRLFDDLSGKPPLERVEQFYLGCVDIFFSDLENVQQFYRAMANNSSNRLPIVNDLLSSLEAELQAAADAGELRAGVDVEALAYSFEGLYSNVITLAQQGRGHASARRLIAESLKQHRQGIAKSQA